MLYQDRLGLKPRDWIPIIAKKYGCSEDAVKKDWSERKRWMQTFISANEVENLALDILFDYELASIDACKLYEEAKDTKTKIQTFWLRVKTIQMKHGYLRELGALKKMTTKFTIEDNTYKQKLNAENYPPSIKFSEDVNRIIKISELLESGEYDQIQEMIKKQS